MVRIRYLGIIIFPALCACTIKPPEVHITSEKTALERRKGQDIRRVIHFHRGLGVPGKIFVGNRGTERVVRISRRIQKKKIDPGPDKKEDHERIY
jgi:hypothetical protein